MLTVADPCPGASTDNQCLSFVIVNFEFVGIHPSLHMFDTRFCLFDKGTKINGKGRTEKLCIVWKLVEVRTGLADDAWNGLCIENKEKWSQHWSLRDAKVQALWGGWDTIYNNDLKSVQDIWTKPLLVNYCSFFAAESCLHHRSTGTLWQSRWVTSLWQSLQALERSWAADW